MILTESGVNISIVKNEDSNSKLLIFNKKVRIIEISKDEAIKIGSALIRDKQTSLTGEIRKLIYRRFFKTPKTFREIKDELKKSVSVKSSSLNVILAKLIERKELKRKGKPRTYIYLEVVEK
jgi:hypothetical protein